MQLLQSAGDLVIPVIIALIVLFAAREGLRAASRHVSDAHPSNTARILDVIAAAALYVVSAMLTLFPSISQTAGDILLALCALALAASCASYLRLPALPRPALRGGKVALHAALLCVWAAVILICLTLITYVPWLTMCIPQALGLVG